MSLELSAVSGARTGERQRFDKSVISLGRHPQCDFRFDPERDLDVSARHAEIREREGRWTIRDTGSRNGIFVNGTRVDDCVLSSGDVLSFGEHGPRLAVQISDDLEATVPTPVTRGAPLRATTVVSAPSGDGRARSVTGLALLLAVVAAGAYLIALREARQRGRELEALAEQTDSLTALYNRNLAQMAGQMHQLDSALGSARAERDLARAQLGQPAPQQSAVDLLATRIDGDVRRREAAAPAVDYTAIAERNGSAVALIAVEWEDGKNFTGTGFSVTREGMLVTNRHLVQREEGRRPRRIMVIFSDTRLWVPARIHRIADGADLALLQIEVAGPFPTVRGLSRTAAGARVGSPVAIIGYPLGVDTPMEGSGVRITARSTLGAGTLSKNLSDVVQIDAYAGEGSSGSPVFDGSGNVIAVVYGGAREAQNRIVYAVPLQQLEHLLPIEARGLLR